MNDEPQHKHRKYWLLCVFAVFIAILGVILPEQEEIAFEIVKNNTDLCNFNHTSLLCDGTRQSNVTYYTNNTPIVLYIFAHASAAGGVAGVFLYRDDILIEAQSGRPLASPEQTWRGITAIIPKNTSYRVNFTNYHHFEWYEDSILSGKNGTLSIYNNYTNITQGSGGGASFDGGPVNLNGSNMFNGTISNYSTLDFMNNSLNNKVNKTGDTMTGQLDIFGELNTTTWNDTQHPLLSTIYNITYNHGVTDPCTDALSGNCPVILQELGTNKSNITARHRMNPANDAYGILVNAEITNVTTLQNSSYSGWGFFSRPRNDDFYVGRFTPGLSEFTIRVISNTSFTVYQKNTTINSLAVSGTGNWSIVMADSTGRLQAFPMNGSGAHYGCFATNGSPYPGTPGC